MTRHLARAATCLTAVAALALTLTGCATSGVVVDKGSRTDQTRVNGKTTYKPCLWVKFRDDTGDNHTVCTTRAKWRKAKTGDRWTG